MNPVSLNASFPIRAGKEGDVEGALKLLVATGGLDRIIKTLDQSEIVHSARFAYLLDARVFQILTVYDGGFEQYVEFFRTALRDLFQRLFGFVDPRPLGSGGEELLRRAVDDPDAFARVLRTFDIPALGNRTYSAFGELTVKQIRKALGGKP